MVKVSFTLPPSGIPDLVKLSLPCKQGQLQDISQLSVYQEREELLVIPEVLGFWPDGSAKWVMLECYPNPAISTGALYCRLEEADSSNNTHSCFKTTSKNVALVKKYPFALHQLLINDGQSLLKLIDNQDQLLFSFNHSCLALKDDKGDLLALSLTAQHLTETLSPGSGKIEKVTLSLEYQVPNTHLCLRLTFDLYLRIGKLKCTHVIHNSNRAMHPNGHWDLGDPNSFNFHSLNFEIKTDSDTNVLVIDEEKSVNDLQTFQLAQLSSGGVNWQSPIHVNCENKLPFEQVGYSLTYGNEKYSGSRAKPAFLQQYGTWYFPNFWQNFPKSLELQSSDKQIHTLTYGLFPRLKDQLHELQGGEKKSHAFWFSCQTDTAALNNPKRPYAEVILLPEYQWIRETGALSHLPDLTNDLPINQLIENAVSSPQSFFDKREQIDEYGWRHFGDLYADHETSGYQGETLFVSHYNNQYDPLFGLLSQFIYTNQQNWLTLADDLARHVIDIDIYDTDLDKAEYNKGLFWHTDHYLPAQTCTHRSFSQQHQQGAYEDHAGGGGPGGQHCYTTGLTYHYWLTGNKASKETVLSLAQWITHYYEGQNTLLELILAFKNRHTPGLKNQISGQYPLDRGIANYINALLDAYDLSTHKEYVGQVAIIIQNTVHPNDDIAKRNLSDVENCWFYTVFLQAVGRYLDLKASLNQFDRDFCYARDSLLHYADWMLDNETPYLDKPEILEFPNDTWAAQDLRKAAVLASAWYYDRTRNVSYLDKALFFRDYVTQKLHSSEERHYTRIIALLMLNHGTLERYQNSARIESLPKREQHWPAAIYQLNQNPILLVAKELGRRLCKLSIRKEFKWLRTRLG